MFFRRSFLSDFEIEFSHNLCINRPNGRNFEIRTDEYRSLIRKSSKVPHAGTAYSTVSSLTAILAEKRAATDYESNQ